MYIYIYTYIILIACKTNTVNNVCFGLRCSILFFYKLSNGTIVICKIHRCCVNVLAVLEDTIKY